MVFCLLLIANSVLASSLETTLKNMKKSGARVSVQMVNLTHGTELFADGADQVLNPASSIKLFTAYQALKKLGVAYTFKTEVYQEKDQSLCVKGGGDPSFVMEDLYLLVQNLKRKGVERYSGKIGIDATVFDEELYPEDRSDQNSERAYNAPISGLNFNYNTVSVFVNPTRKGEPARIGLDWPFEFVQVNGKVMTGNSTDIAWDKKAKGEQEIVSLGGKIALDADEWRKPFRIRNPSKAFGQAFAKMLADFGVVSAVKSSIELKSCTGELLTSYSSKPLSFIVQLMDKYSNNFIADTLVKAVDHEAGQHQGSATGGLSLMRADYLKQGIDLGSKNRNWVSGSGLTNDNRISASDFIKLMKLIYREKTLLPEMFTSLPLAGVDGTLKKKYLHTLVEGKLRGKTGTLSGVQSLVGVYPNEKGDWIAIAFLVNGGSIPESELAKLLGN